MLVSDRPGAPPRRASPRRADRPLDQRNAPYEIAHGTSSFKHGGRHSRPILFRPRHRGRFWRDSTDVSRSW